VAPCCFGARVEEGQIYDFEQRIARYTRLIAKLRNGDVAFRMLDHLASLGFSVAAVSNHAV